MRELLSADGESGAADAGGARSRLEPEPLPSASRCRSATRRTNTNGKRWISPEIIIDMSHTPLYVRLATDSAKRLDDAVAKSGLTKRQIVEDAVREHLGAGKEGLVVGRISLQEPMPEVLTAGEAAALLRVAEPEILEAAERGELPGRRIGDDWRFAREALMAWLAAG
jgi:excisionase family DNA binding protein